MPIVAATQPRNGLPRGNSLGLPRVSRPFLRKVSLFYVLQAGGWIAFGAVMYVWGLSYWTPGDALVNKVLLVTVGFLLTLVFRSIYRAAGRRALQPLVSAFLIGSVSFCGAALWRESQAILFQIYSSATTGKGAVVQLFSIPLGTLLYDGFVLLVWSLLYYAINGWLELEDERRRTKAAEDTARAARLRALQSQLEPHFLFNTLNAISTLVAEEQNAAATRMIARLSDFLRLTLETTDKPEISVAEELAFVRRYLEIEQIRFGGRLQVTIEAQPEVMNGMVPALILQPLVENAVKHGVLPRELGGAIAVRIARWDGVLHICVGDDGTGLSSESLKRGVGLRNTAARLAELYDGKSCFSLSSSPAGGVTATIELPFRSEPPKSVSNYSEGGNR
jgi:two-component system LytT family sensor kinase